MLPRFPGPPRRWSLRLAVAACLGLAATAHAQDKCSASGVMSGEKFSAPHCAVAYMREPYPSVTLWFSESPITPQERDAFRMSAYADAMKDGKTRTMLLVAFCPGGGQATASPAAVKSMDMGMSHAKSAMAGRQWLLKAKEFRVDSLAGEVRAGSRLVGRIAGTRESDGRYAWDLSFDVTLPQQEAAAGIGCD